MARSVRSDESAYSVVDASEVCEYVVGSEVTAFGEGAGYGGGHDCGYDDSVGDASVGSGSYVGKLADE